LNDDIELVDEAGLIEAVEPDAPEVETGVVDDHDVVEDLVHQGQMNCLHLDDEGLVENAEHQDVEYYDESVEAKAPEAETDMADHSHHKKQVDAHIEGVGGVVE
jgi:hypothetical protein